MSNKNTHVHNKNVTGLLISGQPITGQVGYDSTNGNMLISDGTSWNIMGGASNKISIKILDIMNAIYLYKPTQLTYEDSVAIVINNYISCLRGLGFTEFDEVSVRIEKEDEKNIEGYFATGLTVNANLCSNQHTYINKNYVDIPSRDSDDILLLELCEEFLKFRNGLGLDDSKRIKDLYEEILFMEKLSGE